MAGTVEVRPRKLLCLTGFMGSGKTTVGRVLAHRLGWHFVDLDDQIEARAGMQIADIFQASGEPAFRALEHAVLASILGGALERGRPTVIALGGGTIAQELNLALLRDSGCVTVWLDCPMEELLVRCAQMNNRPLFRDEASFRQLYEQRLDFYQKAQYRVSAEDAPERVAEQIVGLDLLERMIA